MKLAVVEPTTVVETSEEPECPSTAPFFNGSKCVTCYLPKYWNVDEKKCLDCPAGENYDIAEKICRVCPEGQSYDNSQFKCV